MCVENKSYTKEVRHYYEKNWKTLDICQENDLNKWIFLKDNSNQHE